MNEHQDLKMIEQESYCELMQDGLTEVLLGLVFLVLPLLLFEPSFVGIFVVFYIILMPQAIESFRKKHTYPRIGYVKLQEEEAPKLSLGVAMVVLVIFIIIIVVVHGLFTNLIDRFFIYRWLPAVFGFIMWGPSLYLKDKTGQSKYYLFGLFMSVTGIMIGLADFSTVNIQGALYMLSWGTFFVVLGLLRFLLFIRKYPVLENPEDDIDE
ncbi:MAG: hypothetical protein JW779_00660 [Candidatus Thorarchaeota archaeon]|nr:hypothetical protein [Candidatus Thorarchaeota archaeon]